MAESYRITVGLKSFDRPYGAKSFDELTTQGSVRCGGLHPGLLSTLPPGAKPRRFHKKWMTRKGRMSLVYGMGLARLLQGWCIL